MFDPYHKWLAIPPDQRPPTYYQLLGISPDERDAEVIEEAALQRSAHLRTYQLGPHAKECTRLLNEISQAKVVLLNPSKRQAYDAAHAQKPKTNVTTPASAGRLAPTRISTRNMLAIGLGGGGLLLVVVAAVVVMNRNPAKNGSMIPNADSKQGGASAKKNDNIDPTDKAPRPFAAWTFETDSRDALGDLHGTLTDGAAIQNGRLRLGGAKARMLSAPLTQDLLERTLEVWLAVGDVKQAHRYVMALGSEKWDPWDGILFGYPARKWYPGSSYRHRSAELSAPLESASPDTPIHVAAVYRSDNSIQLYRNGQPYGQAVVPGGAKGSLQKYERGVARVCLGAAYFGDDAFVGEIEEARLYDQALTERQIKSSFESGWAKADKGKNP